MSTDTDSSPSSSPGQPVAQTFKILVLGDSGVGKTSLIHYRQHGYATPNMLSTIGVDYSDMILPVRGVRVKLRVWDTAGQERFHTFTKQFFRGTHGVLLVYDLTSLRSFTKLNHWLEMLRESGLSSLDTVIVGNKCDLEKSRAVPEDLAKALSIDRGCPHLLTSTVTGNNVKMAFYKMAESLVVSHNIFVPGLEAEAIYNGDDDITQTGSGGFDVVSKSIILSKEHYLDNDEQKKKLHRPNCCSKN